MKRTAFAIFALGSIGSAFAAAGSETYWYGGMDYGMGKTSIPFSSSSSAITVQSGGTTYSGTGNISNNPNGFKLNVGRQFNKWYSLEAYYADLGKVSATAAITSPSVGSGTISAKASGFGVDGGLDLPFTDEFSMFVKVGAFRSTASYIALGTVPGATISATGSASNTSFTSGLGFKWHITPEFGMRLQAEAYKNLGGLSYWGDYKLYSLGGFYKF